jgi:hypothetical protein
LSITLKSVGSPPSPDANEVPLCRRRDELALNRSPRQMILQLPTWLLRRGTTVAMCH